MKIGSKIQTRFPRLDVGNSGTSGLIKLISTAGDEGELKITTDDHLIIDGFASVESAPLYDRGFTWTARSAAEANQWRSVTYGNGLFVAVTNTGTNRVMTSPDGVTWTARSATEANQWFSVTYGNGLFVAVSYDGTNRVMTSPDGVTWTARSATEANQWRSVTYGNGLFVAVSVDGTNRVMTSPDGMTWTARSATEANQWRSVTYGNGLFVAVSVDGTNRVMTSPDGVTWTARVAAEVNPWYSITYGNGLFVAISSTGTNRVMTSGYSLQTETPTKNIYQGGMVIQGDVGIGTTSPQEKLHVAGNTLIEDVLKIGDPSTNAQALTRSSSNTTIFSDANYKTVNSTTASEHFDIAATQSWCFTVHVVGQTENNAKRAAFKIEGLISRDNANNTTLDASTVTTIFRTDANLTAQAVADDTNERLLIQVADAGSSGDTYRWSVRIDFAELTY
jgi:hypothetical protein